jgi:hypothetical protein
MNRTLVLSVVGVALCSFVPAATSQEQGQLPEPVFVEDPIASPAFGAPIALPLFPAATGNYSSSAVAASNPLCETPICWEPDGYRGSGCWHEHVKPCLQRSHWGYCNYFAERPFGDATLLMLSAQVNCGSEDMLMLYHYDFYPPHSQQEAQLTTRGRYQLSKMVWRLQITPVPITIQLLEGEHELNQRRLEQVVEVLTLYGVDHPDEFVTLGRQKHGVLAPEALVTSDNLLQSIELRGRTMQTGEAATFGGAISTGFGN